MIAFIVPAIRLAVQLLLRYGGSFFWFAARQALAWYAADRIAELIAARTDPSKQDSAYLGTLRDLLGYSRDFRITVFQLLRELIKELAWRAFVEYIVQFLQDGASNEPNLKEIAEDVVTADGQAR